MTDRLGNVLKKGDVFTLKRDGKTLYKVVRLEGAKVVALAVTHDPTKTPQFSFRHERVDPAGAVRTDLMPPGFRNLLEVI